MCQGPSCRKDPCACFGLTSVRPLRKVLLLGFPWLQAWLQVALLCLTNQHISRYVKKTWLVQWADIFISFQNIFCVCGIWNPRAICSKYWRHANLWSPRSLRARNTQPGCYITDLHGSVMPETVKLGEFLKFWKLVGQLENDNISQSGGAWGAKVHVGCYKNKFQAGDWDTCLYPGHDSPAVSWKLICIYNVADQEEQTGSLTSAS